MKTVRFALQAFLAGIVFAVYAKDLPSRFDWRDVDGKCYISPVRGMDSGPDRSYAYAPMDSLEAARLIFCEQKGWNEFDETVRNGMLFQPGDVASNIANAESKDGVYSGFSNFTKYPCITKSLDWMIRRPFGGRYVTNISFHDGIAPDYDPATGDEDLSGYWEAAVERLKNNLRETPFMAGMQHVDEYVRSGKYSFFPPYPQTVFLQPEYYRTVLVVGWDDEVPANYFRAEDQCPEGPGAWIVKSSRGEGAGDGGYFYVSFYDRSLLKTNEGMTFHLKDDLVLTVLDGMLDDGLRSYGAVYSYDLDSPSEFGMTYRDSYGIMFTADRDALIGGIGIFDLTGRSYKIYARTGCQAGKPASGTLVLSGESVSNRLRAKGYNVYPLSNPFEVKKGQRFSIMVEGSGLAFMRKDKFVKGRYFHGSKVAGSEWYDIAVTAEEEEYQDYSVPFITAYEKAEGVFLQASDGDFVDLDGTIRTEYGVEVKWETTVKAGTPVYDLYRAPEGTDAFKLVKSGLRELRYVDLLSTYGGELEIDRKYDYKVVDTVHDIESNVNSGFAGTLPRLLDVEPAKLWLTGEEGPYNARLTWNAYNPVYTVSAEWHLLKKRGGDLSVSYDGKSSDVGIPGDKKEVDVSKAISLITPKKGHGVYDMTVHWTAYNKQSGNSKKGDPDGKRCDVNVYFNKYNREAGEDDISNWFRFWPEDGAIDPQYFKQEVYVKDEPSQFCDRFYFNGSDSRRGNTNARLIAASAPSENYIYGTDLRKASSLYDSFKEWGLRLCGSDDRYYVWKPRPVAQYYLSDNGAAIGDRITGSVFSYYVGPDVGEDSKGLKKVADTIEHELKHGCLFEELYKDCYCLACISNGWLFPYENKDWTEWSKTLIASDYSFLEDYAGKWVIDTDKDSLADSYEPRVSQEVGVTLDPTNSDSLGLAAYNPEYAGYGDNEFLARLAESSANVWTNPNNDWAFPGSQVAQCYQGHQNTFHDGVVLNDPITGSCYIGHYPYWGDEEGRVKKALQKAYPSDPCQCCCGHVNCVCSVGENLCDESDMASVSASAKMLSASRKLLNVSAGEVVTRDSGVLKEYYPGIPGQFIDGGLEIVSVGEGVGIDSGDWYYSSLAFPVAVTNAFDETKSCIMRGYLLDSDEHAVAWATVDITVPANSTIEENLVFDGKDIFVAYNTAGYSLASVVLEPYESNYCAVYDMTNAMASTDMEYENYDFLPPDAYMYLDYANENIDWQGLTVSFDLYKETTNDMRVVAVLSDTNGQFVAQKDSWVSRTGYKTVELLFSREQINYSGYYGPFVLSLVQVLDGSDVVCGARNAYMTQAYTADDFRYESAQPLSFRPQSFWRRYSGNDDVADVDFSVESASSSPLDCNVRLVVRGADGSYAGSVSTNATLALGSNRLSASIKKRGMDDSVVGPYHVSEIIFIPDNRLLYDRVRFFPKNIEFSFAGSPGDPSSVTKIGFVVPSGVVLEGDSAAVSVLGGNADSASSVKVYLAYNTAAATDVDLGKLKFPLTLSWEAGEVGEKVITIPIKKDAAVEDDEFFTLQLADAQGMELGEERVCTVTIHDPGYDELEAKIKAGTATKAEQTAWDKLQKAKAPYVCVLADPANAGTVTGSGLYAAGKKVTLKATANKGYVFAGWGTGNGEWGTGNGDILNGQDARSPSVSFTMPAEDVTLMAAFATTAKDAESLKIAVEDLTTESDGSIGTLGSDGTRSFDLGACVTSLSLPKLAVSGLPAGLKFDAKTNRITGKATKPGVYTVKVTATNASATGKKAVVETFNITVPNLKWDEEAVGVALEDRYLLQAGVVPTLSNEVAAVTAKGWKLAISGLPSGVKFDAKKGAFSGIATKEGFFTVYFTATRGSGKTAEKQVATATFEVAFPTLALAVAAYDDASATNKATVAGGGRYPFGKKVTLKATAAKGNVFRGWYDDEGGLVAQTASYPYVTTDEDVTLTAVFVTGGEDKASIAANVDGWALEPWVSKTETHASATNIWAGVYLEWPIEVDALSLPTIKVSGLPTGLKFTDKPVTAKVGTGKTAVTVTNVPANTIYGAPTAASKMTTDKKTGATIVTPSAVKVTVTTAGKSTQTYQIDMIVDALPAWAAGNFDGPAWAREDENLTTNGIVALTVAANGKISGKMSAKGQTWTLAANSYDSVSGDIFLATVIGKNGKLLATNAVEVTADEYGYGVAASDDWTAYQNLWKRTDTKADMPIFKKNIVVDYLFGAEGDKNNTVKITFKKDGAVAFAGKKDGVSVSGSAQLVWNGKGWQVTFYASPKPTMKPPFDGWCEILPVELTMDEQNIVTEVSLGDEPEMVQLWEGGPYWATKNIGAKKPGDSGYHFWWGDTVGYKWENEQWVASDGSSSNFSFRVENAPTYGKDIATLLSEGWITADGVLAPEHDAAQVHWGGDWRMPTYQEVLDLKEKCNWSWTTMNGVEGYIVTGKGIYASNSIFLSRIGVGFGTAFDEICSNGAYWSSVPMSEDDVCAWHLSFWSFDYYNTFGDFRERGLVVRPVQNAE